MTIHTRLLCVLLLASASSIASASSFYTLSEAISGAIGGTSATSSSAGDDKIVIAARDDAASFVATDGDIRGVHLEAAFVLLRGQLQQARDASDLELARAILAL
ncbi:DUF2388 domain-containing protein [Lysobacter sp. A286]